MDSEHTFVHSCAATISETLTSICWFLSNINLYETRADGFHKNGVYHVVHKIKHCSSLSLHKRKKQSNHPKGLGWVEMHLKYHWSLLMLLTWCWYAHLVVDAWCYCFVWVFREWRCSLMCTSCHPRSKMKFPRSTPAVGYQPHCNSPGMYWIFTRYSLNVNKHVCWLLSIATTC